MLSVAGSVTYSLNCARSFEILNSHILRRAVLTLLNAELNPIRHLLALVGAHHILHFSRVKVKNHYIYGTLVTKSAFSWNLCKACLLGQKMK